MWKSYNRFYKQHLKKESSVLFISKNVHIIPEISNIRIFCFPKFPVNVNVILLSLTFTQLFLNKKSNLMLANKSTVNTKLRRKQPLGVVMFLFGEKLIQFLHHCNLFIFPLNDSIFSFSKKIKSIDFIFNIKIIPICVKLSSFFNFFQALPRIQAIFCIKKKLLLKKRIFLFRLFKIPIKINVLHSY